MKNLVKVFDVEKEEALKKWREYCTYLKNHKDKADDTIRQLKDIYYQLSQGNQVIDIYQSMKIAGKNEFDQPRLAIIRADRKRVVFQKRADGAGAFWSHDVGRYGPSSNPQVAIPKETFNPWATRMVKNEWSKSPYEYREMINRVLSAPVPIIPAEYRPDGQLHRYFIMWEVDKWENAPPRDPYLLRRISANIFVVLAAWDLTELERAVMRGSLVG